MVMPIKLPAWMAPVLTHVPVNEYPSYYEVARIEIISFSAPICRMQDLSSTNIRREIGSFPVARFFS